MLTFWVELSSGPGSRRRVIINAKTQPGAVAIAERDHAKAGERVTSCVLAGYGEVQSKYGV